MPPSSFRVCSRRPRSLPQFLRINPDGSVVRISDVGRAELGAEFYDIQGYFNAQPSAAMAIRQAAGANALETADNIRNKLDEMSHYFPGMKIVYPYDTTPFAGWPSTRWSRPFLRRSCWFFW